MKIKFLCLLLLLASLLLTGPAFSQMPGSLSAGANAQRIQDEISDKQRQIDISNFQKEAQEYQRAKKDDQSDLKPPKLPEANNSKDIYIEKISFSPSSILPDSFFNDIRSRYQKKKVSVKDIFSIITDINNAYLAKGYATAKAYLTAQDLSTGNLFISLVEGRVNEVNISGQKNTNEDYIRSFFTVKPYDLVDLQKMQDEILYFNAYNDAKTRLSLAPGQAYGTTNLDLIVTEPAPYSASLFCDNAGQEETGLIREGVFLTARSLAKRRDILSVGGVMSEGSYSAFGSYEIPEPWLNTRVGVGFDYSQTELIKGYLEFMNITGDYYDVYLYVKKPFWVTEDSIYNYTFTLMNKDGSNYINDFKTQNNQTQILTAALDNIRLFSTGYLYSFVSLTGGINKSDNRSEFFRINYNGEYQRTLAPNFSVNAKLRLQYGRFSDDRILPSSEQIQVGGVNTVRGYREGMLIANSGMSESVELQYEFAPMIDKESIVSTLKLFTFFDAGSIFPNSNANLPSDYSKTIYSTGVGVRTTLFDHVEAQLIYAKALEDHPYFPDTGESFLFFVRAYY